MQNSEEPIKMADAKLKDKRLRWLMQNSEDPIKIADAKLKEERLRWFMQTQWRISKMKSEKLYEELLRRLKQHSTVSWQMQNSKITSAKFTSSFFLIRLKSQMEMGHSVTQWNAALRLVHQAAFAPVASSNTIILLKHWTE